MAMSGGTAGVRAAVVRLLVVALYMAPATVPVLASLVHAAGVHRERQLRLMGESVAPVITHSHGGGPEHSHVAGHAAAVDVLLAAADALEHDTDAIVSLSVLRLAAHVPAAALQVISFTDPALPAPPAAVPPCVGALADPPVPPPRSGPSRDDTRTV